jgi:hypothetical protein
MSQPESTGSAPQSSGGPTREQLKAAFKAFRKKLKVTRLDAESGLNYGPTTGGKKFDIVAITPPQQFSKAVWDELVKQGKLKHAGQGTYELVEE